jgi:twinkle protein
MSDESPDTKPGKRIALVEGEAQTLAKRGLNHRTCEHWGYLVGSYKGKPCQIANYRDPNTGAVVAQKLRFADKTFAWTGNPSKAGLYGAHLWRDEAKALIITEGEIDALTVSQLQDHKWPVVSVPNGAQAAVKDIGKAIEWLEKFEQVVFMFDNDDPGRGAAVACASLLTPGKAKIARLPLKDANDMLVAGRGPEVIKAYWEAKTYRPDGIVGMAEVIEEALKPVEWGKSWPWKKLTDLTYGIRTKEIYALGAGVGIGKTDVCTQMIAHFSHTLKEKVGIIYLEQQPPDTAKRIAGKIASKPFHVPDAGWTPAELEQTLLQLDGQVYFYNHFGSMDWDTIKGLIKFMALGLGCKRIFLDHLTALVAHEEDERRALDGIMADMAGLVQSLDITILAVSHLSTPEGKPHEEGGRVMSKHFTGSRAIMRWANFMFGLERNQQAEDEVERRTTTFRILKDRNTGRANGATFGLLYDPDTGLLQEAELTAEGAGFSDETKPGAKQDF